MTENAATDTAPDQQPQQQVPPPGGIDQAMMEEQIKVLKDSLINQLGSHYLRFINESNKILMHPGLREKAKDHVSTGFLWFKEAILAMSFAPVQQQPAQDPNAPQSNAPAQSDEAQASAQAPEAPVSPPERDVNSSS